MTQFRERMESTISKTIAISLNICIYARIANSVGGLRIETERLEFDAIAAAFYGRNLAIKDHICIQVYIFSSIQYKYFNPK